MSTADQIKSVQLKIASVMEQQGKAEAQAAQLLPDLSEDTRTKLIQQDLLWPRVDRIFARARPIQAPTGWRKIFLCQSEEDRQETAKLLKEARVIMANLLHDGELQAYRHELSRLVRQQSLENRPKDPSPAKRQTPTARSPDVDQSSTSRPADDAATNMFTNLALNVLNSGNTSTTHPFEWDKPKFVSGGGGDFAGGGATGSWDEPSRADDLGASNFS